MHNYPRSEEGRSPQGHVKSLILTSTAAKVGKRLIFPFRMADGRNGEKLSDKLTFWVSYLRGSDEISVDLNGRKIDSRKINRFVAGKRRGKLPGQRFEISLSDCPPFRGDNKLGLTLKSAADRKRSPYMEELEVVVKGSNSR